MTDQQKEDAINFVSEMLPRVLPPTSGNRKTRFSGTFDVTLECNETINLLRPSRQPIAEDISTGDK